MKKLSIKRIFCILSSIGMVCAYISCSRNSDEPKPVSDHSSKTEKCTDDKATNKGEDLPCKYEESKPKPISIGISVVDTELPGEESVGKLTTGTRYRAIFYKEDGSYFAHNDYAVDSSTNQNFSFENGDTEKYTIVVYSFNSTEELPEITEAEKGNIKSSVLDFDVNQGQLMYAKLDSYKPSNDENIEVKLKHKFIPFVLSVDNSATLSDFYKIEKVEYAKISNNQKGKISLSSGEITERTNLQEQNVIFSEGILPLGAKSSSTPVWLNVEGDTNLIYKLKTDLPSYEREKERAKRFEDKEISKSISVKGNKYEEIVAKQKCGAWISDTEFLEFMCQNLGTTASSFDMAVNLGYEYNKHPSVTRDATGAMYQWGKKDPVLTQEENLKNKGAVTGWDSTPVSDNNAWNSDFKTALDPCPDGYRIPKESEISKLWEYNIEHFDECNDVGIKYYSTISRAITDGIRIIYACGMGYFLTLISDGYRKPENGKHGRELSEINIPVTSKTNNEDSHTRILTLFENNPTKIGKEAYGVKVHCVKE